MKSILGYFLVLIVFICVSLFYYNKLLNDNQIIKIFDLESIVNNNYRIIYD